MVEDAKLAACNSPWYVPPLIAPPLGWGGDIIGNDILSVTIEGYAAIAFLFGKPAFGHELSDSP